MSDIKINSALVIVDYNLSRIADIRHMVHYAKRQYGLTTVLIRSRPTELDGSLADYVIDADPLSPDFVCRALEAVRKLPVVVAALLPFSDNAVQSGADLAEALKVRGDSAELAVNAFSKISHRNQESALKPLINAQNTFVPQFSVVRSYEEFVSFAERCPNGFVLKPSCEGNNRGVLRLTRNDDLRSAFEEVKPYLNGGLICEEIIDFDEEFSFDGIGHLNWITEKDSLNTRYPVEKGQLVPALAPQSTLNAVAKAGTIANLICGQNIGPFHNEVKFDPGSKMAAVIEPNRRPAGMKIWHLAKKAYGIDLFEIWIDQLMGQPIPKEMPKPKGVAAIRMLAAPSNGVLSKRLESESERQALFKKIIALVRSEIGSTEMEWYGFQITALPGARVFAEAKDNSFFIGEVCLFTPDFRSNIKQILDCFEAHWQSNLSAFIDQETICAS